MSQDKNSKKIRRRIRRAYVISTMSITLVIFMLGAIGYLMLNAKTVVDNVRESVAITVMLKDNISQDKIETMSSTIKQLEGVKKVSFKSKADASKEFKEFLGNDFEEFLDENPIPASFDVMLVANRSDIQEVERVATELRTIDGVYEVLYQDAVIRQLSDNLYKFNLILVIFGGVLLVISMMLINNTIRITIASKQFLINTMKLVGATPWFIKRPFVVRSILQGGAAGIISCAMLAISILGLNRGLPEIGLVKAPEHIAVLFIAMITLGILISVIFTAISVTHFVRAKSNRVYLY